MMNHVTKVDVGIWGSLLPIGSLAVNFSCIACNNGFILRPERPAAASLNCIPFRERTASSPPSFPLPGKHPKWGSELRKEVVFAKEKLCTRWPKPRRFRYLMTAQGCRSDPLVGMAPWDRHPNLRQKFEKLLGEEEGGGDIENKSFFLRGKDETKARESLTRRGLWYSARNEWELLPLSQTILPMAESHHRLCHMFSHFLAFFVQGFSGTFPQLITLTSNCRVAISVAMRKGFL